MLVIRIVQHQAQPQHQAALVVMYYHCTTRPFFKEVCLQLGVYIVVLVGLGGIVASGGKEEGARQRVWLGGRAVRGDGEGRHSSFVDCLLSSFSAGRFEVNRAASIRCRASKCSGSSSQATYGSPCLQNRRFSKLRHNGHLSQEPSRVPAA